MHTNRLVLGLVALTALAATSTGTSLAGRAIPPVRATQELAGLRAAHEAYSRPTTRSAALELVPARRPLTGEQTMLPVLAHSTGPSGVTWLQVRLPGRPNGLTGWIEQPGTHRSTTGWHITVDTTRRLVGIYDHGRLLRSFSAVVGKPSTPTPAGQFFVEEAIQLQPSNVGAPFALALSARSDVFQEFDGGPGQIALHGLDNVGGTLGTAASHGCIRLTDDAMKWLVLRIAPGTPVTITP